MLITSLFTREISINDGTLLTLKISYSYVFYLLSGSGAL
jgi:hypothetical protein